MIGKLAPASLEARLGGRLGAARAEVLYGPRPGGDGAIVGAGAGRVLAITTDPLSLIPALGPERSARLAAHLVASDLWTTGIPPAWASITLSLPPSLDDATLDAYLDGLHRAWCELEVAVVTGHTGRYDGCDLTIVGAATVIGMGDEGRWVGAPFVEPGDHLLLTGHPAFEATALAAQLFPERLRQALAGEADADAALERARSMLGQVIVVDACRVALRAGVRDRGVSALHDVTEGGMLGALIELARAACAAFGIDPLWTLSEGALLICARAPRAAAVLAALAEDGIVAHTIGEVVKGHGVLWLTEPTGHIAKLLEPEPDPYWDAYARAVREGWR